MTDKSVGAQFIIAVGSSAGGLEPMRLFFNSAPHDSATYIILRHIPVSHKSELQLILKQHSKLEFIEATDKMAIEKDKVYLPPASMYMTIEEDRLRLQPRAKSNPFPNFSVDIFLESLAKNNGKFSIAVILSGAGNDGTKGVSFIKNAGGMVIAQNPNSCIHNSMPLHAINSGNVDQILLPAAMPAAINHYVDRMLKLTNQVERLKNAGGDISAVA
jgi:chemotaxis response regulator CheB